ncbi:MAG TPA: efflux RND transporter periplasmic adaptor subunit [Planktothrix sp.]|jgi:HlyD family secretion protein
MFKTRVPKQTDNTASQSRLRKPILIAIILIVIGLIAFGIWSFIKPKSGISDRNVATVERGSIDVRIVATGTIRPLNEVKVSPKSTGLIKKLYVKQGDYVQEGQVLAQMDASNLAGQLEGAKGSYLMAKDNYAKLSSGNRPQEIAIAQYQERRATDIVRQAEQNIIRLKAQVESQEQQLIRDEQMAKRQAYLDDQGAISDQDSLNAQTQAKVTLANLTAARRELTQAEATLAQNKAEEAAAAEQHELSRIGNRKEDISSAEHAVLQAKGQLDTLESNFNDMTIKAPFAGVITQKYADTGAIVTPTTSAATTSATSSSIVALAGALEVVAEVAETDIGKIQLGQDVEIIPNAFPEKSFHGKVTQIAPEAVVTQNVTTFEVHSSIEDDRHHRLLSGMNVSARFVAGQLNNVILVPTVCIMSRHGKTGVLLAQPDGTPKFKQVKTGPTVGTKTAVLHGLDDGDKVLTGLSKEQLDQQGYGDGSGHNHEGREGHGGGHGGGGTGGAPIPRSFGR